MGTPSTLGLPDFLLGDGSVPKACRPLHLPAAHVVLPDAGEVSMFYISILPAFNDAVESGMGSQAGLDTAGNGVCLEVRNTLCLHKIHPTTTVWPGNRTALVTPGDSQCICPFCPSGPGYHMWSNTMGRCSVQGCCCPSLLPPEQRGHRQRLVNGPWLPQITHMLPVPRDGSQDTVVDALHPTGMERWILLQDLLYFLAPLLTRASPSHLHHLESINCANPSALT